MEEGDNKVYICICNVVTDIEIINLVKNGVETIEDMQKHINICDTCYCCEAEIELLIKENSNN